MDLNLLVAAILVICLVLIVFVYVLGIEVGKSAKKPRPGSGDTSI